MMHHLIDTISHEVCGWIGAAFFGIVAFGRVDLDWGDGCTESILAEWTGLLVLVGLIVPALTLWSHFA